MTISNLQFSTYADKNFGDSFFTKYRDRFLELRDDYSKFLENTAKAVSFNWLKENIFSGNKVEYNLESQDTSHEKVEPFEDRYKKASETDRLNNLGVDEMKNGNISMAITYYKQALDIMPQNDDALVNLAICYNKMGKFDDAIQLCLKAIQIDPDRAGGYRTIGDSYYYQSDVNNVIKWYKEAANKGDTSTANWLKVNRYF